MPGVLEQEPLIDSDLVRNALVLTQFRVYNQVSANTKSAGFQ